MDRNEKKTELFTWLDRVGEAADFVNTDHLNLINLSAPPLTESKEDKQEEEDTYNE